MNSAKDDVQAVAPKGMPLEKFLGLPADNDIDVKIKAKQEEIKVAEGASEIQEKRSLSVLNLPTLPPNVAAVLGKTIEGVSADAERRVKEHIEQHINRHRARVSPEGWLGTGVAIEDRKVCPMCAQPLDTSPLIDALRDYFSDAYREFQRELDSFKTDVAGPTSAVALIDVQKVVVGNDGLLEFWGKYVKESSPELSFEGRIQPVVERVRNALAQLVERKTAVPLDAVPFHRMRSRRWRRWMCFAGMSSAITSRSALTTRGSTRSRSQQEQATSARCETSCSGWSRRKPVICRRA